MRGAARAAAAEAMREKDSLKGRREAVERLTQWVLDALEPKMPTARRRFEDVGQDTVLGTSCPGGCPGLTFRQSPILQVTYRNWKHE